MQQQPELAVEDLCSVLQPAHGYSIEKLASFKAAFGRFIS
jgi:hypothetical protein